MDYVSIELQTNPEYADQCKRCMTKKQKEYEFPLKEIDISIPLHPSLLLPLFSPGTRLPSSIKSNVELPKDHRRLLNHKKGDWVCQSCGQSNKGIPISIPVPIPRTRIGLY